MIERKAVFTVADRGEGKKPFWVRIGTAFTNKDGSLSVLLDALPVNGKLQIREEQQRDEAAPDRRQARSSRGRDEDPFGDFGRGGSDSDIPF